MRKIKIETEKIKFFYLIPTLAWITREKGKTLILIFLHWMIIIWDEEIEDLVKKS